MASSLSYKDSKKYKLSIRKATNKKNKPMKEKHARNIILGTFQEKGAYFFWSVSLCLPILDNPIVAWKFCYLLHKVLREGHPNVLHQSQNYINKLEDFGNFWVHLKVGYGILIARYCNLLISKLKFHNKIDFFTGNFDANLDRQVENESTDCFHTVGVFSEYINNIITMQATVFDHLHARRSKSTVVIPGQSNIWLMPLIICIQESAVLYECYGGTLFVLYLNMHQEFCERINRQKYFEIFLGLKQFYINASNQQYIVNLVEIPELPEDPLRFMSHECDGQSVASDHLPAPENGPELATTPMAECRTGDDKQVEEVQHGKSLQEDSHDREHRGNFQKFIF